MARRNWTHEELLLAFNLYCKLPFGLYHNRNPDVIALSHLIDRTPSAVAMKLSNFASFDPIHQSRGIKGLSNTSLADGLAWEEFTSDWDKAIWESELLLARMTNGNIDSANPELSDEFAEFDVPDIDVTQVERITKVRVGQNFFRKTVLANYGSQCCICKMPIPPLLIASHIIPWRDREDLRLNPHNGLCMCVFHDKVFDAGYLTVDEEYRIVVSRQIFEYLPNDSVEMNVARHHRNKILLPDKFLPSQDFLKYHADTYFLAR